MTITSPNCPQIDHPYCEVNRGQALYEGLLLVIVQLLSEGFEDPCEADPLLQEFAKGSYGERHRGTRGCGPRVRFRDPRRFEGSTFRTRTTPVRRQPLGCNSSLFSAWPIQPRPSWCVWDIPSYSVVSRGRVPP